MKLEFRHQSFQADAVNAICEVFAGQPFRSSTYMIDQGIESGYGQGKMDYDFTGFGNASVVISDNQVLEQIKTIQRKGSIKPSEKLDGRFNLTVEMETGVGKTYTYIKAMYELNKRYGWSKFIIVVPSIAIREGVHKSFEITDEHFSEEYGKKIRHFIYNSAQLTEIERFASDSAINVMIINSQAFNARGKDARRILMKLDEFRSRRPHRHTRQNKSYFDNRRAAIRGRGSDKEPPEGLRPTIYDAIFGNAQNRQHLQHGLSP